MATALPSRQEGQVVYHLRAGEHRVELNARIGSPMRLLWSGAIACTHCGRATKKSFAQGYCYPCFKRLAQCDTCIMKPETCHYYQGTCREPEWGETHCFQPHIVYLANSSGLKVGITRKTQMPTRWLDQGAIQALPILEVNTRQQSGMVEMLFKEQVADRTNWRAMLKGDVATLDLCAERDRLLSALADGLAQLRQVHGEDAIRELDETPHHFHYPVETFPRKVVSHNFDKQPQVEGILQGVKGQYLILDTGVINLRKFTGYEIIVS
ncbi:DUF2797 domain-containing protein [Halomonas sp. LY9]|uniref:DUF2797 domain-containing protein n=2 Tax=Vreelandella lutescens TaxID=1602943 RepID=A0ABQ1PK34_9GAMM|nr:DUF2797 domain-containing protein [Halomonas lutescens]GGC98526.1 hypothetical protein GCM10011382_31360 [Halomonas lutescens]